jgi:hypothetical protein
VTLLRQPTSYQYFDGEKERDKKKQKDNNVQLKSSFPATQIKAQGTRHKNYHGRKLQVHLFL